MTTLSWCEEAWYYLTDEQQQEILSNPDATEEEAWYYLTDEQREEIMAREQENLGK